MVDLSVIIPAHNEQKTLPASVRSVRDAAEACGLACEIIVVNDASTDQTARTARALDAVVLDVNHRNISRVRNAGAAVAKAPVLCFLDADSHLPAATLAAGLAALRRGCVACGPCLRFDEQATAKQGAGLERWNRAARRRNWLAATCIFVSRDPFETSGGFDERYLAMNGVKLARRLKRLGRVELLDEPIITSSRKLRLHGVARIRRAWLRYLLTGGLAARFRWGMGYLYDGRRE